jgi:hypothetical protein
MSDIFYFDETYLEIVAKRYHDAYVAADPFPHVYIDNFLPNEALDPILADFPEKEEGAWQHEFNSPTEVKQANDEERHMPPSVRHLLTQFNSAAVCRFLQLLTDIEGLIPDPYFLGGGQHRINPGGFLKVHADFNIHRKLKLDRRINLLLYLNKDWDESYGGHIQLWDTGMSRCVQKILPIYNRCVIFNTTSESYHGHPDPLTCPEDRSRRSLAFYYYTSAQSNSEQTTRHSTLFKARPDKDFPIEPDGGRHVKRLDFGTVAKQITPPVVWDLLRKIKGVH